MAAEDRGATLRSGGVLCDLAAPSRAGVLSPFQRASPFKNDNCFLTAGSRAWARFFCKQLGRREEAGGRVGVESRIINQL